MSKKNTFLVLLAIIVATILVITFFGMEAALPEETQFTKIEVYGADLKLIEGDVTEDTKISIDKRSMVNGKTDFYFFVKATTDREIDENNKDYTVSAVTLNDLEGVNFTVTDMDATAYYSATGNTLDQEKYDESLTVKEDGIVKGYNNYYYYKLTLKAALQCKLNIVIKVGTTSRYSRNIVFSFYDSQDTGHEDVEL